MRKFKFTASLIIMLILSVPFHQIYSATARDLQNQINDVNSQIQALDKEISQYQAQISQTNEKSNTLANLIKELTLTRAKLVKEKEQTQKKITAANLVISELSGNINLQQKSVDKSKSSLIKMLNDLNRNDNETVIERLLAKDSMANMSREYNNILSINEEARQHIKDLLNQIDSLNTSKNKKVIEQKKLTTLKKDLAQKQQVIEITKQEKNNLLVETKNQESAYKKLLADRQKKRDEFEKKLSDYEAQLKFILNPNLLPTEGSGVLSWPLDYVFVTQLFGKTVAAKRLYISGSHSGVDFRASLGTQVKSMGTGTIIGTGDTDQYCKGASFGKWVFIKYNNGLSSTFGHLSVISGIAGQKVAAGDVVGLSGNTGHSTAPHLHVTVYASQGADVKTVPSLSCNGKTFIMPIAPTNAYLDPMLYLPKISSNMIKNDTARD
jgi:murein DD-endopeptidase MepM/ murein hydrolase activator NlpD